jgi:hypothetical protein
MPHARMQRRQVAGEATQPLAARGEQQRMMAANRTMGWQRRVAGKASVEAAEQAEQRRMAAILLAEAHSKRAPAEPRGAAPRVVLPHSRRHRQVRATPVDRRGAAQPARVE